MLVRVSIQCAKMLVCVLVIVLKGSVLGLVQALIVPFGAYLFFLLNILRRSSPMLSRKKNCTWPIDQKLRPNWGWRAKTSICLIWICGLV